LKRCGVARTLASTSGTLGAGHIEFAADKLAMRDRRTLPSRQPTYRRMHVRVDRLEDAISYFHNVINELRRRVSTLEQKSKRLAKDVSALPPNPELPL
jgi:hypothetical protein